MVVAARDPTGVYLQQQKLEVQQYVDTWFNNFLTSPLVYACMLLTNL